MLSNQAIRTTIKDIEREYKDYKDGGREFITQLSNKLNRVSKEEKKIVFEFFLREIRASEDHMVFVATATFRFMNAIEVCDKLKEIYLACWKNKSIDWKEEMESLISSLGC